MKFSISHLKDHLTCPALAHFRHVLRRGLPGESKALAVGRLVHQALEARFLGVDEWWEVVPRDDMGLPLISGEAAQAYAEMVPLLKKWKPSPDWEIHSVEQAFEAPLGAHTLQGRLDALVKWNGQWWSLQFKTCSERQSPVTLTEKVRLSFHECAYQYLAEKNGYAPFGGTLLQIFRKLPQSRMVLTDALVKKRVKYDEAEREQLALPPVSIVTRTRRELNSRLVDIAYFVDQMDHRPMAQNTNSCWGMFGNSKCAYYAVCHEGAALDEAPFVDLEDRYAAVEED